MHSYKEILERNSKITPQDIEKLTENILDEIRNGSIDMQQLDKSLDREWKNSYAYQKELQLTVSPYEFFNREWHEPKPDHDLSISELYIKDINKVCFELDYTFISPSNIEAFRKSDFYNTEVEYNDMCDYPEIFSTIPLITLDGFKMFNCKFIHHIDGTTVILPYKRPFIYDMVDDNRVYKKHNITVEVIPNDFVQCAEIQYDDSYFEDTLLIPESDHHLSVGCAVAVETSIRRDDVVDKNIEEIIRFNIKTRVIARYLKKYKVVSLDNLPLNIQNEIDLEVLRRYSILMDNPNVLSFTSLVYLSLNFGATFPNSLFGINYTASYNGMQNPVSAYKFGTSKSIQIPVSLYRNHMGIKGTSVQVYYIRLNNHLYEEIKYTSTQPITKPLTVRTKENITNFTQYTHSTHTVGERVSSNNIPSNMLYIDKDVVTPIPIKNTMISFMRAQHTDVSGFGYVSSVGITEVMDGIYSCEQTDLTATFDHINKQNNIEQKALDYRVDIGCIYPICTKTDTFNVCDPKIYSISNIWNIVKKLIDKRPGARIKLIDFINTAVADFESIDRLGQDKFLFKIINTITNELKDIDGNRLPTAVMNEMKDCTKLNQFPELMELVAMVYCAILIAANVRPKLYYMNYNMDADVDHILDILNKSQTLTDIIGEDVTTLNRYKYQLYKLYELSLANPDAYMRVVEDQMKFRDNVLTLGFAENPIEGSERISFNDYVNNYLRYNTINEVPESPYTFNDDMLLFILDSDLPYPTLMELRIFVDGLIVTDYYKDRDNVHEYLYVPRRYFQPNSVIELEKFDMAEYREEISFTSIDDVHEITLPESGDTIPINIGDILIETNRGIEKVIKGPTGTKLANSKIVDDGSIGTNAPDYEVVVMGVPNFCNTIDVSMLFNDNSDTYYAIAFYNRNNVFISGFTNRYFNPINEIRTVHTTVSIPEGATIIKVTNFLPSHNAYSLKFLIKYESNKNKPKGTLVPITNFDIITEYDRVLKKSGKITSPNKKLNTIQVKLRNADLVGASFVFRIYKRPKSIRFISTVNGHPSIGLGTALQKRDINNIRAFKNGRLMPKECYRLDNKYSSFVLTFLDTLKIGDKIFVDITPYRYTCVAYNKEFAKDCDKRRLYNIYKYYGKSSGTIDASWKDKDSEYNASAVGTGNTNSIFYNLPLDFSLAYYDMYVNGKKLNRYNVHRVDSENMYIIPKIIYNSTVQIYQKDVSLQSRWDKSIFAYIKHVRDERFLHFEDVKPVCTDTIHHYKNQEDSNFTDEIYKSVIDIYNYDNIPMSKLGPFSSSILRKVDKTHKYDGIVNHGGKEYSMDEYFEYNIIDKDKLLTPDGSPDTGEDPGKPEYNIEDAEIVEKSGFDFYWNEVLPKKLKDPNTDQFTSDKIQNMYPSIADNYMNPADVSVIDLNPDKYFKYVSKKPNGKPSPYIVLPLGHMSEVKDEILMDASIQFKETQTPYYKNK